MKTIIKRQSKVERTARFVQTRDKFSIENDGVSSVAWDVDVALPAEWNVGLIVGESGAGKTTLARKLVEELQHSQAAMPPGDPAAEPLGSVAPVFITPKDAEGNPIEPFAWPAGRCVI